MKLKRTTLAAITVTAALTALSSFSQAQSPAVNRDRPDRAAAGVEFKTGGVGLDARQEMASQTGSYNLQLEFVYAPVGEYLSNVDVQIADARGTNVLSTQTDGPWLLAKLPAGSYTVTAHSAGATQRQQITVGGGKRHIVMRFPASSDRLAGNTPAR